MKKLSKLTKMVLLLLIVACANESEILKVDNIGYQKRINQVINENDNSIQRIMYSMLDKEDKHKYWQDKIQNLLNEKSLNEKQISALNLVLKSLTIEIFDNNINDEKIVFKTFQVEILVKELIENFEANFIIDNFYSFRNGDFSLIPPPDESETDRCTCNKGSLFSCATGVDCKERRCHTSPGCGFLLLFECNGRCL